jgi:hypothetical protein
VKSPLSYRKYYHKILLTAIMLFIALPALHAHVVVNELENMTVKDELLLYLKLGYRHILPLGFDHILFVLSLFLLSPRLKPILWQSFAFTVAHSVTLGLAMFKVVKISPAIIEPLIALSIMYVALENIFVKKLRPTRIGVVFIFGLVHGLGFASALSSMGLPSNAYVSSLVMFNAGVELGQATVILTAFLLFGKWFGQKTYYRKYFVIPLSTVIAAVALMWFIQRILF